MVISITPAGGGSAVVLCAGREEGPLDDLSFRSSVNAQVVGRLRAAAVNTHDRKNEQSTLSFTVLKKFGDSNAAERFLLSHRRDVPNRGDVTIQTESLIGGTQETLRIPGAMLTEVSMDYIGCAVLAHYSIVGGAVER